MAKHAIPDKASNSKDVKGGKGGKPAKTGKTVSHKKTGDSVNRIATIIVTLNLTEALGIDPTVGVPMKISAAESSADRDTAAQITVAIDLMPVAEKTLAATAEWVVAGMSLLSNSNVVSMAKVLKATSVLTNVLKKKSTKLLLGTATSTPLTSKSKLKRAK
jgi:hypothetical protein